jgi:hypothetical protein
MGQPTPIELDHIDGDPNNNDETNLCLICPNCHAQTPTYKGKNAGRPRHRSRDKSLASINAGRSSITPS